MNLKSLYVFAFCAFAFSCGTSSESASEASEVRTQAAPQMSSGNEQVITAYMALKDALVATDFDAAREKAGSMLKAAESADLGAENLSILESMTSASDIEEIRKGFYPLSQNMYEWAQIIDKGDMDLYWQYCPMAMDDTGAHWLSLESEIMNPYFGDVMLHCGTVAEEL